MSYTPTEIVDHFQAEQANDWHSLLQQTNNRLADCVTIKSLSGKETRLDQIAPISTFSRKTGRLQKTEGKEMEYAQRIIYSEEFADTRLFDEYDASKLTSQTLPITQTQKEQHNAANRTTEQQILEAALGTAYEGREDAKGVTEIALPATQTIPLDYNFDGSSANTGLTFDKFARLRRLAMENEAFGQDVMSGADPLVIAVTAAQIEDLYHSIYVNNKEYLTAFEGVRQGEVNTFLGVKIVRTEQVAIRDIGGGDFVNDVPAWIKSRMCFGFRDGYTSRLTVRDDLDEAIQLRAKFASGASRTEEKGVWKLPCLRTA